MLCNNMENYNNPSFILLISKESKQWTINIILNVTYTIHRQILYLIVNIIKIKIELKNIVSKNF